SVTFTNGARVSGNVVAGQDINFAAWNARVGGNAWAGGTIVDVTSDPWGPRHVEGERTANLDPAPRPNAPVPVEDCDPLQLDQVVASPALAGLPTAPATVINRPNRDW